MSSRCPLARLNSVVVVGAQVAEDHSGETALETAQGLGCGIAGGQSLAVVRPTQAVEADLGHRDAMQGGVELTVARAGHPDATAGIA